MTKPIAAVLLLLSAAVFSCVFRQSPKQGSLPEEGPASADTIFHIKYDEEAGTISVFRGNESSPVLTQNARENFRPYIHPIAAPDGKGTLTEYSPGHHKHQTGLYWGFTRLNGRDYFHHPGEDHWRRVAARVISGEGSLVKWQTVYDLLDENGEVVLTETQNWSMQLREGKYILDLEWKGEARKEVTIGKYDYGGLFLRMPWKEGIRGQVVNTARQRNEKAEGQRAMWVDVGMQVEGRSDLAHIAIFDHPDNGGYPHAWRVDHQMGIGPARSREADWKIAHGATEIIRHQLVVYTGELNDVKLNKAWAEFSGKEPTYATSALWAIAQKEGLDAKFLTPEEAVKSMSLIEGFAANVWASEPMITQPMAFCWDSRGRLWIAENRDYESRSHGFSNSGDSRILILEDTDRDGKADSKKVFMEGIAFPAAIAVGFDGVFIGAPPNLLFVPDRNRNDKADMDDIEVRLTGWGIRDRHETLNSLHWGPDGWLYGLQGFATPSRVRKPAGEGRIYGHKDPFPEEEILSGEGTDINGGVWRYHPLEDKFEVVAHGFSNPWGIDYNAKGQLFITACVIPHLWHVIPGGIYHRQGGQHFNPYTYNDIKTIADHSHRSAHGGARIYQSDAFPEEQQGRIFMANIHEHAILSDILERKGSGYTGKHGEDVMTANNAQWVGFSLEIGPDGALYVLDWHDADICGKEVLNHETGRIFRISPEHSLAENWEGRYANLEEMADEQLVSLQTSKSDWHSRRARLELQNRAAKGKLSTGTHAQLREIFLKENNPDWRLRAMWTLHVTGGFTMNQLISALEDEDEYVRAWAIQLICEKKQVPVKAMAKFYRMGAGDPSAVVRLYLASALQRINVFSRFTLAGELVKHAEDSSDHNLPKMIWYGIEPLMKVSPGRTLDIALKSRIPLITRYIARRAVDADALEALVACIGKEPPVLTDLLKGMQNGLEGRIDLVKPAGWDQVYARLLDQGGEVEELAIHIAQYFGDREAVRQYFSTLKNKNAPAADRAKALEALAAQQREELVPELPALLEDPGLRGAAISAIAAYEEEHLGELLLRRYPQFTSEEKLRAIHTLSSRPAYGWQLTQAIKNGRITKREVPVDVARQLRRVVGSGFVEVWGPIDQLPSVEKAYKEYRGLLSTAALAGADLEKGRTLFMRTCGSCHKMYGKGAEIGPDLTGSNRSDIDYLLFNVLEPSSEIQDDYKLVVITTRDGRTYSGNIIGENDRQITLRMVGQEPVIINKSTIQTRETTPLSMMPAGLFEPLTDQEIIDLVAYLRS
ncbi:putative membrane-bound dehydrogenase-like protein [Anseongella ginsenosidimutans]|uniref:Putative membrane-bound dehydrogenase-like protein n=1 Tax=Anseongella ginsenosidimutans TaxID=496056 RepID=A0A4R3KU39_9SPHI|nr:PVC-type heme-binding CxxCH protein [Anseongella ginsenosidimutans]QEC53424.1 c-type cytochrome [Anseongella ginsenosidimutans]TCS88313.1 putative membrane-bound dehydrogenase-like protein [Anseongella ginsenosidimutans]